MERDQRLDPDPQFVRRLGQWFVAELGSDHPVAPPETRGGEPTSRRSDTDVIPLQTHQPSDRRYRLAFAAAASLVALAVVGILALPGGEEPTVVVPVVVDGDELDNLCETLATGYPRWALDPEIEQLPYVRARLRHRFDAVLRKIDVLARREQVELTTLRDGLAAARGAVDELDATVDDANLDRSVRNLDTLVARWGSQVASLGGHACAPPRLGAGLTADEGAVLESFRALTDPEAPTGEVAAVVGGADLMGVREQLNGLLASWGGVAHATDLTVSGDTASLRYEVRATDPSIPGGELLFDRSTSTPDHWTVRRPSLCAIAARYAIDCPSGGGTQQGPGG